MRTELPRRLISQLPSTVVSPSPTRWLAQASPLALQSMANWFVALPATLVGKNGVRVRNRRPNCPCNVARRGKRTCTKTLIAVAETKRYLTPVIHMQHRGARRARRHEDIARVTGSSCHDEATIESPNNRSRLRHAVPATVPWRRHSPPRRRPSPTTCRCAFFWQGILTRDLAAEVVGDAKRT
jgi:hypothetical protein